MGGLNGQDVIPPLDRRNLIMEEDEQFSQRHPELRIVEQQLLGIQQSPSEGLHLKLFETQLRVAARNLKDVLQIVGRTRGQPEVPRRLMRQANLLLWDVKHCYTPANPSFLLNGSEEVSSLLVFIHDKIVMHMRRCNPDVIDDKLGRFDLAHMNTAKPRVRQPFTRREPSAFEASRPKKSAMITPPELVNVLNIYPELSQ